MANAPGQKTAPAAAQKPTPAAPVQAAAPAAQAAAPAAEKPKKEPTAARPRLPKYPDDHVITVLKENAKSRGANERFKRYHTGITVKAYLEKIKEDFGRTDGQTFADMRWDEDHKFIHIGPTVVDVPKPAPAAQPAAPAQASA